MERRSSCPPCHELRRQLRAWYVRPLGQLVQATEQDLLNRVLSNLFGYHLVQIGAVGWEEHLLAASRIQHRVVLDKEGIANGAYDSVSGEPDSLPIATDSVDAIVLPHTLEFAHDPHQILREAERALISEGRLIIIGFNPWSLWGLWRLLRGGRKQAPWCGQFLSQVRVSDWLALLGFGIETVHECFFRPPLGRRAIMNRLAFFDQLGPRWWPVFAGLYVLVAIKRVSTLTPLKPRWRTRRRLLTGGVIEPSTRTNQSE